MSQELDQSDIARNYLLGKLSEEERTRFEEQYFFDDAEFEQLEVAEDELIEQYVREELSAEDTRRFKALLVSPGISERVEVARLLAHRTVQVEPAVTPPAIVPVQPGWWERFFGPVAAIPAFRPAFAMSLLFLMLTTIGLVFVWTKLRSESQRLAQQQQQQQELQRQINEQKARYDELEAKLGKTQQEKEEQVARAAELERLLTEAQQRPIPALTFPVLLNPGGGSRGTGGQGVEEFSIPNGTSQVGFKVNVTHGGDDYNRYNASVSNSDSRKQVVTRPNLRPFNEGGRKYITVNVPANALRAGSYRIHVDGITPDGQAEDFDDYNFRVSSR